MLRLQGKNVPPLSVTKQASAPPPPCTAALRTYPTHRAFDWQQSCVTRADVSYRNANDRQPAAISSSPRLTLASRPLALLLPRHAVYPLVLRSPIGDTSTASGGRSTPTPRKVAVRRLGV
ncbi:hypothetical protein Bbelb_197920 [Branchiostoma belcheri]|nr:hypothetical protein Bbelb_197920 [Branchiostoma belcheri]